MIIEFILCTYLTSLSIQVFILFFCITGDNKIKIRLFGFPFILLAQVLLFYRIRHSFYFIPDVIKKIGKNNEVNPAL